MSSDAPPGAGSACSVRQAAALSDTWIEPSAAGRIQCSTTRSNWHSAPRSTYTHSSPAPALIHALVKSYGPPMLNLRSLSKNEMSPTCHVRSLSAWKSSRYIRLCDGAPKATEKRDGPNPSAGLGGFGARPRSLHVCPSSEPETMHVQLFPGPKLACTRASIWTRSTSGAASPPSSSNRTQAPGPFTTTCVTGLLSNIHWRSFFFSAPCWLVETASQRGSFVSTMPSVTNCAVRL